MKKIAFVLLMCTVVASVVSAQQARPLESACSPINLALTGDPTQDVTGLRLGVWAKCRQFTGLDLNLLGGQSLDAYGLQIALVQNKVLDRAGAFQLAIGKNDAADMHGIQIALWNNASLLAGFQVGLFNSASDARGLQIGLLNVTDSIYGFQIGLLNIIRTSPIFPCFPIINTVLVED